MIVKGGMYQTCIMIYVQDSTNNEIQAASQWTYENSPDAKCWKIILLDIRYKTKLAHNCLFRYKNKMQCLYIYTV